MFRLDGKVALVTGSSRGLGATIALELARAGASAVVINGSKESPNAQDVMEQVRAAGAQSLFIPADVGNEVQVENMFAEIDQAFKRIDILVNNAGVVRREDIFETGLEGWNEVINTHLTGMFLCSRAAMMRMRAQNSGRIITNSSVVAWRGAVRGFVHYAAAKAGQIGLTRTLARTAAPFGITVNAIAPGVIETDMLREAHGKEGIQALGREIPLGLGTPEDVAAAVVFLASDEAKHITGATIDINGGMYFR